MRLIKLSRLAWRYLFIFTLIINLILYCIIFNYINIPTNKEYISLIIYILNSLYGLRTYEKIKLIDTKSFGSSKHSIIISGWRYFYIFILILILINYSIIIPIINYKYQTSFNIDYDIMITIIGSLFLNYGIRTFEKGKV